MLALSELLAYGVRRLLKDSLFLHSIDFIFLLCIVIDLTKYCSLGFFYQLVLSLLKDLKLSSFANNFIVHESSKLVGLFDRNKYFVSKPQLACYFNEWKVRPALMQKDLFYLVPSNILLQSELFFKLSSFLLG